MWGVTGKTVFNAKAVMARLELHIRPARTGYFEYQDDGLQLTDIRWVDDEDGFIKVPTGDGLGIEVDEEALKALSYDGNWQTPLLHWPDGSLADW